MARLLEWIEVVVRKPIGRVSQVALAISIVSAGALAGGVVAFLYGVAARNCGVSCKLAGGLFAVICAAGAFSAGGLLGLLFGAPGVGGGSVSRAPAGDGHGAPGDGGKSAAGSEDNPDEAQIRPNTSLERVADWLTTMLVGIGLANLPALQERATSAGIWITREITGNPAASNGSTGVLLMLWFGVAGFFLLYLWSVRFLPSELKQSYSFLSPSQIRKIRTSTKEAIEEFLNDVPIFRVPGDVLRQHLEKMKTAGVDADTCADVQARFEKAVKLTDEPLDQFGAADSDGYRLSATVTPQGPAFQVVARLALPAGVTSGTCFWLLHNAFTPGVVSFVTFEGSGCSFQSPAGRAFWIGAVVPRQGDKAVRLAFDLAKADGATEAFCKRPGGAGG